MIFEKKGTFGKFGGSQKFWNNVDVWKNPTFEKFGPIAKIMIIMITMKVMIVMITMIIMIIPTFVALEHQGS